MLESKVEEWMRTQITKRGGLFYKFVSPGNVGVPDRIIIRQGEVIFVELKQERGRLSAVQKAQIARLREHGCDVRVVYGKDQAVVLVDELFPPARTPRTTDGFGIEEWR